MVVEKINPFLRKRSLCWYRSKVASIVGQIRGIADGIVQKVDKRIGWSTWHGGCKREMSVILYTGIPGSGKTYRVMVELSKPAVTDKYMIFHNIDGLRLGGEFIKDWREIPGFLNRAKQEDICKYTADSCSRAVLVIIDEAQMEFDKSKTELKSWLSWHRHLGQDVWLICQSNRMIHSDYYNLIEYEVRAKKSSVVPFFLYQYEVRGEKFKTERIGKKKEVFALYRSFDQSSAKKGVSKILYYAGGLVTISVILLIYFFGWGVKSTFAKVDEVGKKMAGDSKSGNEVRPGRTVLKEKVGKNEKVSKDQDPSEWRACAVLGAHVAFCDDSGRVGAIEDVMPGWHIVARGAKVVRVAGPGGRLEEIAIGARRARPVPLSGERQAGRMLGARHAGS